MRVVFFGLALFVFVAGNDAVTAQEIGENTAQDWTLTGIGLPSSLSGTAFAETRSATPTTCGENGGSYPKVEVVCTGSIWFLTITHSCFTPSFGKVVYPVEIGTDGQSPIAGVLGTSASNDKFILSGKTSKDFLSHIGTANELIIRFADFDGAVSELIFPVRGTPEMRAELARSCS